MRGRSIYLDGEIGLTNETILAIPRLLGERLQTLHLTDYDKYTDVGYAALVSKLPALEVLNLRYQCCSSENVIN